MSDDINVDFERIVRATKKFAQTGGDFSQNDVDVDAAIATFASSNKSTNPDMTTTIQLRNEQVEVLSKLRKDINELEGFKTNILSDLKRELLNQDKICNEIIDTMVQPLDSDDDEIREKELPKKKEKKKPKSKEIIKERNSPLSSPIPSNLGNNECIEIDLVQEDSMQEFLDSIFIL